MKTIEVVLVYGGVAGSVLRLLPLLLLLAAAEHLVEEAELGGRERGEGEDGEKDVKRSRERRQHCAWWIELLYKC